jgi:hypothetical protein
MFGPEAVRQQRSWCGNGAMSFFLINCSSLSHLSPINENMRSGSVASDALADTQQLVLRLSNLIVGCALFRTTGLPNRHNHRNV